MAVVIRDADKPPPSRPLPAWARAPDARVDASDCALFVGAALAALDPIVRAPVAFAGVWRQRLALRAAAATVHMTGRERPRPISATHGSCPPKGTRSVRH